MIKLVSVYLFFVNCNASSIQRCPSFPIIGRFLCLFAAGYRAEDRKDFNRILVRFSIQSRQLRRQCWTDERFQLIGGSINPFTASGVVPGLELETVSSGKIVFSTLGSFFNQHTCSSSFGTSALRETFQNVSKVVVFLTPFPN